MAPPKRISTPLDGELHQAASNTSTVPLESPESQSSESPGRSHPSQSTPVTASTISSESPDSPILTPPNAPRPSKRARTTRANQTSTSSTPSTAANAQSETQVATRPSPRLVIRMPRRPQSPPARTVHLQGGFLEPGDSQYETAKHVTGDRSPYWFRGDNMLGYRDGSHTVGGAEGFQAVEKAEEVVEICLDEEKEESEKSKGKRKVRSE